MHGCEYGREGGGSDRRGTSGDEKVPLSFGGSIISAEEDMDTLICSIGNVPWRAVLGPFGKRKRVHAIGGER